MMHFKTKKGKKKNKKGFSAIQGIILTVVVIAVTLAVGLMILGQLQGAMTPGSPEANATTALIEKLADLPVYIGILIIVAVFGFIIAYLSGWLGGRGRRGG